jgi:hypothetical protein
MNYLSPKNLPSKSIEAVLISLCILGLSLPQGQAANIDFGIQTLAGDIFANAAGVQLSNTASVYIGTWKTGYTTSSAVSSLLEDFRAGTRSIATLADFFVIGQSTTYGGINPGSQAIFQFPDAGLASQPVDILAFSGSASTSAAGLDYLALRLNENYQDSEAQSRETNVSLVVPSYDTNNVYVSAIFAGRLVDNGDTTGQFQTIPEPSSGVLIAGVACFLCVARSFQRKI